MSGNGEPKEVVMNQSKWPKRGERSEDCRYYTHTDGTVHTASPFVTCSACSMADCCQSNCPQSRMWKRVDGVRVPSAEELAACEAMRGMIEACDSRGATGCAVDEDGIRCWRMAKRECPARAWLARCGQADAWQVTP